MASLSHAIHSFQSGDLSEYELLAHVDRVLASDNTESARQLEELLSDDHTRIMLPPEVYAELRKRVHQREQGQAPRPPFERGDAEATRMQVNPQRDPTGSQDGARDISRRTLPTNPPSMTMELPAGQDSQKGIGDTLNGRFVLEECIGFGGMGTVYKALDLRKLEASDRKPYIAIKVLNLQFRGHPKSLITLQREAKKAQALAHPNIVTVYDFDRDGSTVFLTMEYLSGKPLSQVLRAPGFGGLPLSKALPIVEGMGRALAYAHERGFVHCDFKPANVVLTDSGDVKVIDFGIARVFRKPEDDVEATVFDPGSLGGLTPAYASPEMLEHREPDPRDDIYALACITYELLTGRHPFDRATASQARNSGLKPARPKNLGANQWRALKCGLAFDRNARTPTIQRFLSDLRGDRKPVMLVAAGLGALAVASLAVVVAVNLMGRPDRGLRSEGSSGEEPAPPAQAQAPAPVAPAPAPVAPALTMASVAGVLNTVSCSALLPSVDGDTVKVQGYLSAQTGAARLKDMLSRLPGARNVIIDTQPVADDKCDTLAVLAPYWAKSRANSPVSIRTRAANGELVEGEPLVMEITTPGFDAYAYVDYFVLDGSVAHLLPNVRARAHQTPPNYSATIGGMGNWVVSKPFGKEMVVLIMSPEPLFDGLRPASESRKDYLRALERQLKQVASKHGQDKVVTDFVQITTKAAR
ncbi:serine/threonine-protein kinase [Noviherbaspirillum galbum]|uniref:Protein kinase n=1 Tax=Noviherbaspirillum galbum TaxID=2709383 RepID=A0A6B3SY46_9BURK|nr:serine/threonine-protein kinase [Noviherbaspirillum galbum]NEX62789.1 protein kinase [Noviherbaspirillum galbum]